VSFLRFVKRRIVRRMGTRSLQERSTRQRCTSVRPSRHSRAFRPESLILMLASALPACEDCGRRDRTTGPVASSGASAPLATTHAPAAMAAPQGSGLRAGPFPVPTWYAETFVGEARSADLRSSSVSPGDRVWALLPSILRVGSTSLSIGELLSIEGETVTVRSLKRGESGQPTPDEYWFQGVPGATVHRASVAVNSRVRQGDVVIACVDPRDVNLCPVNAIVTKAIPDRVDVKFVYGGAFERRA
jgi:hypothetical protein